jgi:hypothetical protein
MCPGLLLRAATDRRFVQAGKVMGCRRLLSGPAKRFEYTALFPPQFSQSGSFVFGNKLFTKQKQLLGTVGNRFLAKEPAIPQRDGHCTCGVLAT